VCWNSLGSKAVALSAFLKDSAGAVSEMGFQVEADITAAIQIKRGTADQAVLVSECAVDWKLLLPLASMAVGSELARLDSVGVHGSDIERG
jgi:hypothetical protein